MKTLLNHIRRFRLGIPLRTVAVGLVCFYALASGRSLIPGMCGSMPQADACENPVVPTEASAHACCAAPASNATDADTFIVPPAGPMSNCPWCSLAQSPAHTVAYACLITPAIPSDAPLHHLDTIPPCEHPWTPASRRGPPSPLSHLV